MIPPWLLEHSSRLQQNDPELTNLNLNIRRFDTEMLQVLASAMSQNTILHTLNLTSSLTKASILPLIPAVQHHSSLRILHLSYNRISNDNNEITFLARALETNRVLTELYLDHNEIDVEGATAIANMLRQNETLQVLQLSNNKVRDDGAEAFANVLANDNNTTLTRLMLERYQISSRGVESLLEALESNVTLQYLQVDKHQTSVHQELSHVLATNRAGRHLLRRQQDVPLGLWSYVLGRISQQPDMLYYFLKELPNLCGLQN